MRTALAARRVPVRGAAVVAAVLLIGMGCSATAVTSDKAGGAIAGACGASAGASAPRWVSRYDGPGHFKDFGSAEAVSPDGRVVFVTGRSAGQNLMADYATIAYNAATGARLWVSRYNGPANGPDFPLAIAVSPDGSDVFVTGLSEMPPYGSDSSYATVAYNAATGAQLWARQYAGGDYGDHIAVSPDGRTVIIVGQHAVTFQHRYAVTVAYSVASGAQLWARQYSSPGAVSDAANALAFGASAVFVGVGLHLPAAPDSATAVAYDTATGARLWASHHQVPADGAGPSLVRVSKDGRSMYVAGEFGPNKTSVFGTIAYDSATGATQWARLTRHDSAMQEFSGSVPSYTLAMSPDDRRLFVEGYNLGTADGDEFATAAFVTATGKQLWTRRFGAPQKWADEGLSVAVSPDGQTVYAMGVCVRLSTTIGYGVVGYRAATGARLWARTYKAGVVSLVSPFTGVGGQVADSPDGQRLFVIGYSGATKRDPDVLTAAYRA